MAEGGVSSRLVHACRVAAGRTSGAAASGIADFRRLHRARRDIAPLRSDVTSEAVGDAAVFPASDLARQVTGEVLHVDGGFNVLGVPFPVA